ncbi:MAG: hypothetical protein L3J22_11750 [Xanthomonadales bacterium]|nr:hypothetical protein [Xanthomonadales bacterium]
MIKIITLFCFLVTALTVNAKNLEVDITISKNNASSQWVINYNFSENITAISFENTPYSFIKSDWSSRTDNAILDLSSLQVNFNKDARNFLLNLKGENDQFIRGFYTPFLNFSDGSNAIYIGHYLPSKVKVGEVWVDIADITLALTITASKSDNVLYAGLNEVKNLNISIPSTRQYAYIGNLVNNTHEKFNIILDPKLPSWIQTAYLKAIPEFYNYYETTTLAKLSFSPLFIVNFKPGSMQPRLDGGAINKQIAINIVGDGWQQNPESNLNNVLSLLAHEMAHLWNNQHWKLANNTQIWMQEGGANYFARNALLNFKYISNEEYIEHFKKQAGKCIKALNEQSVDKLQSRSDVYICGEVFYQLSASMIGATNNLDIWNKIVNNQATLNYSENDFIQALNKANVNKIDIAAIENILYGINKNELSRLIEKYTGE